MRIFYVLFTYAIKFKMLIYNFISANKRGRDEHKKFYNIKTGGITTMTNQENRSAKRVMKMIFGEEKCIEVEKALDELSPDLRRLATGFPFSEFYARDDLLDLKSRELITLSTLATQGTLPQLKLHIEAALNVGCTPVQIEQALLQLIAYIGMPKVINAMQVYKEVIRNMK